MTVEGNKAVVRRWIEDVWTRGDFAAEAEIIAPEYTDHSAQPGFDRGLDGHNNMLIRVRTAFPDIALTIDALVGEGDLVVNRYTCRGTHRGDYLGIPATGRQVSFNRMD